MSGRDPNIDEIEKDLAAILGESPKETVAPLKEHPDIARQSVAPPDANQSSTAEVLDDLSEITGAELIKSVSSALRNLLRELRARRGQSSGVSTALEELHAGLSAIVDQVGELHLRVDVNGLYHGKERVLELSPYEDRAMFRAFQHGVRQFTFSQGLTITELDDLISVLTSELDPMDLEKDISTLLVDR